MHESVQKLADGWTEEKSHRTPESCHPKYMWKCDDKPLLLRIDEVDRFEGTYYRVVFKSTGDHDEHPHVTLFETPILDSEGAAKAMAAAIAAQPMRYARKFFDE